MRQPSPFDCPPFPNSIRVGFGNQEIMYCEINHDGRIEFFTDPLDVPALTLTPDDLETMRFMVAHLEACAEAWEAGRAAREAEQHGEDAGGRVDLSEPVELKMPAVIIGRNGHSHQPPLGLASGGD